MRSHQSGDQTGERATAFGGLLLAVALLGGGCFSPRVPDGTIVCNRDSDCPAGLTCTPGTDGTPALCCRGGTCPARIRVDPGAAPPDAGPDLGPPAPDASSEPPPGPVDAGSPAVPVTCSDGARTPPAPGPGRRLHCAAIVGSQSTSLGLEVITGNDPVSSATHGVCGAVLDLSAGPLPPSTLDALVATLRQLRQICTEAGGVPAGAVATGWARQAPDRVAIQARVRAEVQLELEVPDEAREIEHRYRGATRNRRGRIVLDEGREVPEILAWPQGAAAPVRHVLPLSREEVGAMYLAAGTHATFEAARLALRTRLNAGLSAAWLELADLIGDGDVASQVAVGPGASAAVPLAVAGMLRDAATGWFDPARYQARVAALDPSPSPYGEVLGILSPADVDGFFPSLGQRDFMQLRSEPIRSSYGARVLLTTVLLDLLGDEALATEFGFTATSASLGFLLSKLFPDLDD
jgi:hypothetical protein